LATDFPQAPSAPKAKGAKVRLTSVGKPIVLKGQGVDGKPVELAKYKGKVVLIHYWATWCEPCKADMAQLKELKAKYTKPGFELIGVNLDSNAKDVGEYLKQNRLPWAQIYEPGGLDSRLANELGILTLPTMILVDEKGNVVDRNIHVTQLDSELKKRLK
ncbi:MAG: TlpA family protein disulfide reductase, partial [Planctomycetaceae bacterium]|nr:TlpA family protein disulfide reductase [Planctomycetaceae bacterium]